jgi:mono/diheme cytochrome c family protein
MNGPGRYGPGFTGGGLILGVLATLAALAALPGFPGTGAPAASPRTQAVTVTPVQGPSWLHHLGLRVSETRMGEMGGLEPAPPGSRREAGEGTSSGTGLGAVMHHFLSLFGADRQEAERAFSQTFQLGGADLYRLNCQSCHGPDGKGAPPEINSLLGPVRATSAAGIQAQMAAKGRTIPDDMARQLAAQAEKSLRDRLQNGGKKMPPFRHLRGDEIEALLGYLDHLAGVPAENRADMLVPQSAARVGEHVVKGTCHVCHDATGPGGHHATMMGGIIPSLESFPGNYTLNAVVHQVKYGSSRVTGMMGGGMMGGGRGKSSPGEVMPALPYFTEEEIAAAFFYLKQHPPSP